jgi:hypothetical protein
MQKRPRPRGFPLSALPNRRARRSLRRAGSPTAHLLGAGSWPLGLIARVFAYSGCRRRSCYARGILHRNPVCTYCTASAQRDSMANLVGSSVAGSHISTSEQPSLSNCILIGLTPQRCAQLEREANKMRSHVVKTTGARKRQGRSTKNQNAAREGCVLCALEEAPKIKMQLKRAVCFVRMDKATRRERIRQQCLTA